MVAAFAAGATALAAAAGSILARRLLGPGRHQGLATAAHWAERGAGPAMAVSFGLAMTPAGSYPAAAVAIQVVAVAVAVAFLTDLARHGRSRPVAS